MFNRSLAIICATCFFIVFSAIAQAQSPEILKGVAYLASSQTSDGAWNNDTTLVETTSATATVLETLKLLNQIADASYVSGIAWLQSQTPQAVALVAQRILALGLNDGSADALLPARDSLRGAWGGYDGYAANTLDTAYALQALQSTNSTELTTINAGLAFLTTQQNIDGGWGFLPGTDSSLYITAIVSATLQRFPQISTVAAAINKASSFLIAHQNADGGFGGLPSTAYETALVYVALVAVSNDTNALSRAVDYLAGSQAESGSWAEDPYSTALALKALHLSENKPSPPPPPPAGGIILGTLLDAATAQKLEGVTVVLASNPLIHGTTDAEGKFLLSEIPAGSQTVNFSLEGYKSASASGEVVVDTTTDLGNIALVGSYTTGTIAGTITNTSGQPLAEVTVSVGGAWNGSAVTGSDGSFVFTYVTPGEVSLTAAKAGYEPITAVGTVHARTTLTFSPRLDTVPPTATTGSLVGRVVDATWGVPIDHLPEEEGVKVTLSGGMSVEPDPDNGGRFEFHDLAPGIYQATVGMNGFASQAFRIIIMPGVTTDLGTIRLALSISKMLLTGVVTDAISGAPIRGAEIAIVGSQLAGWTDGSGTYAIADIAYPSEITIKAAAEGYIGKSYKVKTEPWLQTLNISLQPQLFTGTLTGRVVDAALETPLSGVSLSLVGNPAIGTTTNNEGEFTLDAVPNGLRQINLTCTGYSSRILTTTITAGRVNEVGAIGMAIYPLPASIRGMVWDADADAPFTGAKIQVKGTGDLQTVTAEDGKYRFDDVNPGMVTVTANAETKPDYYGARLSGSLEAGGILVFNPILSTAPPSSVNVTVQTDKSDYQQGDNVGLTVYLQNLEATEHVGSLHVQVSDPAGGASFETTVDVTLAADGTVARNFDFALPLSLRSGFSTILAEFTDAAGTVIGSGSKRFGVAVSQITVSPVLPEAFSVGDNAVSFALANIGILPVSDGALDVVLTDPEGQVVASASKPFYLGLGESLKIDFQLSIPALKFGDYVLAYTQRDETQAERSEKIQLPNSLNISPVFDSASHRVRETASLTITLVNSGKFDLDAASEGLPVTVSLPDANYSETKVISPAPVVDNSSGSTLLYRFVVPDNLNAGQHVAAITTSLPSGSNTVKTTLLTIPQSILALAPLAQDSYLSEETIRAEITNNGGADTQVQYRLTLYDAKSSMIAEQSDTKAVAAGSSLPLDFALSAGMANGTYKFVVYYKDVSTGQVSMVPHPITIQGVEGSLQVRTDKQIYLLSENVTGLSDLVNGETPLTNGNLHLQVVAENGNFSQKTWTSQYDFQQGVRTSVDSFETPDAITLMPVDDTFDDGLWNQDRWTWNSVSETLPYPPLEQYGQIRLYLPDNPDRNWINSHLSTKTKIPGDFDAMVDYDIVSPWNSAGNNHASGLYVNADGYYARIDVWGSSPTYGAIDSTGSYTNLGGALKKGKLRIQRVGSTYYTYYWNGTAWKTVKSFGSRPVGPAWFRLLCFGQGGKVEVLYDNFTITTHTYPSSGTLSLKYDSGRFDEWGKLAFNADIPQGTGIKFRTRSADTEIDLASATWSDYLTTSGSPITSPKGRWLEVEATLSTTDPNTTPSLYDLTVSKGIAAGEVLWQSDAPVNLGRDEVSSLNHPIPPLKVAGKYFLQASLISPTGQTVARNEYPFYLVDGDIWVVFSPGKNIYRPGETVTIEGRVESLVEVDSSGLVMDINETEPGNFPLFSEVFDLPAYTMHNFSFTTIAEAEGLHELSAVVLQNGTALAEFSAQYETASPVVVAALETPDTVGSESFPLSLTLNNTGKVHATIDVQIIDGSGGTVDTQVVEIPAGETKVLQHSLKLVGTTTYTAKLSRDLTQTLTKQVVYRPPTLDSGLAVKVVTDQASYDSNEVATLIATMTANSSQENLSAQISVFNNQGQIVYSNNAILPTFVQGQAITIDTEWNVGNVLAGTYLVSLKVIDDTEVVVANSSCDLVINGAATPIKALKGQITLDKQTLFTGEPVAVTYQVTNVGNVDLSGISLSIRTIRTADQGVLNSIADQTALARETSYANSYEIDTQEFGAMDYLVVLLANIDGVEETLSGSYFRVAGAPSAPALVEPANGADVESLTPALVVSNASDPNDDKMSYEFEVYEDSGLTSLVTRGVVPETAGITFWTIPSPLAENQTYFWRARAYDAQLYGPWMAVASFRVNVANDPPTAPQISNPTDGTSVAELSPTLTVSNASDADSMDLVYNFEVALDSDFTQIVESGNGIAEGTGTTSWTTSAPLQDNTWYYWRVQADDWLMEGPWSVPAKFFVNTANDPPSVPIILTPTDGSVLTALSTNVVITNSTDPDSPELSYYFEADTVPTFDSTNVIRSDLVVEGQDTTGWDLSGLRDNTQYYIRVKASDGFAESAWSPTIKLFANTMNDSPTTPVLENPSDGTGVKLFTPTLSIHNSTDLDEDVLTYEFEIYTDSSLANRLAHAENLAEGVQVTAWEIPISLTENQTYFWRARSYDGVLYSDWMPTASFMVNTANDAPGAPLLSAPEDGRTVETLNPTLVVENAVDPDNDGLTYDFEVYSNNLLVDTIVGVPEGDGSTTAITLDNALSDNTTYSWRARAFDGDRYGQWMNMATFTTHLPQATIMAEIRFKPETLSKKSNGTWVKVDILLPSEYKVEEINLSTIRLEGVVPAETWPFCIHECDEENILTVKFKREDAISLLQVGQQVQVHVTGLVGSVPFEGMDIIRVTD